MGIRFGSDRHLLDHFETVSLKADNFLRIVCQKPELPHTEIEKNLRAETVIAEVAWIPELRVRLHSIEPFTLQFVCVDFCCEPNAATFLSHVNQDAVAFLGNCPERPAATPSSHPHPPSAEDSP